MHKNWLTEKAWLTSLGLAPAFLPKASTISDSDILLMVLRYGLYGVRPRKMDELAKLRGVTRERVRQILCKISRQLRHPSRREWMERFVKRWQSDENPG